jgi:hypothetical protein
MPTDVGGGSEKDSKESALSNISLRWMVREVVKANCGVRFDPTAIGQWNIPSEEIRPSIAHEPSDATLYEGTTSQNRISYEDELRNSASGKSNEWKAEDARCVEQSFDNKDALKEEVDQLKKRRLWWILEILPTYYAWQDEHDRWVGGWRRVALPRFSHLSCDRADRMIGRLRRGAVFIEAADACCLLNLRSTIASGSA